jgi:cellobiose-specific phosphotransferase system component IIB
MAKYEKTCEYCGVKFSTGVERQKYCTASHRARASDKRLGKINFIPDKRVKATPIKQIERQIKRIGAEITPRYTPDILQHENRLNELKTGYNNLQLQLHYLQESADKKFFGAAIGSVGAGLLVNAIGDNKKNAWTAAIIGGVIGGIIGAEETKKNLQKLEFEVQYINQQLAFIENEYAKTESSLIALKVKFKEQKKQSNLQGARVDFTTIGKTDFPTLKLDSVLSQHLGSPAKNFKCLIYGLPFQGKSFFAVNLASRFANTVGNVLYNASEESINNSFKQKVITAPSNRAFATAYKKLDDLENEMKATDEFIFLDSVNDMNISADQLREFTERHPDKAFVYVMQATKDGNYKGSSQFAHDADIVLKVEDRKVISEKNRFAISQ